MHQEQIKEQHHSRDSDEVVVESTSADSKEALKAELDEVLDEIDAVLEENAEEFVKQFVQKGGE